MRPDIRIIVNTVGNTTFERVEADGSRSGFKVMKLPLNGKTNAPVLTEFRQATEFIEWRDTYGVILLLDDTVAMKDENGKVVKKK